MYPSYGNRTMADDLRDIPNTPDKTPHVHFHEHDGLPRHAHEHVHFPVFSDATEHAHSTLLTNPPPE